MSWRMLKNHWNTLNICLFGQTTKQTLSKFEPWRYWNLENKSNFEGWGLTLVAYKKMCKPRLLSTIAQYQCKSSNWEGVYVRDEMKFCFAVKKNLFLLVSLREKWNEILFSFDLLIYYLWFYKVIACADVSLRMISFRGSRVFPNEEGNWKDPSPLPPKLACPSSHFSQSLIFYFYAILDQFAQNVLPLPLTEPRWETLVSIYITRIARNEILFLSK